MAALTQDKLLEVQQAILRARLEDRRDALLACIDRRLVAQLPRVAHPDAQILEDLDFLSSLGALEDGSYPLEIWLKNAAALAGPRPEAVLFREVQSSLDHRDCAARVLVVRGGRSSGMRVYLREGIEHILGRGRRANLSFPDDLRLSSTHARIVVRDRTPSVRDLGSRHGVFLNERRVEEASLETGDLLRCGRTVFVVEDTTTPITELSDSGSLRRLAG